MTGAMGDRALLPGFAQKVDGAQKPESAHKNGAKSEATSTGPNPGSDSGAKKPGADRGGGRPVEAAI